MKIHYCFFNGLQPNNSDLQRNDQVGLWPPSLNWSTWAELPEYIISFYKPISSYHQLE